MDYHKLLNSGELYDSVDAGLIEQQHKWVQRLNEFNATSDTPDGLEERTRILKEITGTYGEELFIIPPISANNGLRNVHFGKNIVVNFNANFVDDGDIFIGDDTMIGPNVSVITALHPVSPRLRAAKIQYNKPVRIGRNVWLGAGAIILPGVTVGDNSIVGAGSVVTRDVEENTIVVGNPAHVLRKITPMDDCYYDHDKKIPQAMIDKYIVKKK
ncbi:sugar O-acetyltransferase [uncultured Alistipes sp.]|uniref:sugar O-acetyltransferase n=1 Tax=uncultured Alistipes sp. TaxID=538949 RepID=UPI0026293C2E|nr:sugar O-acetyltransferase [uncultured Alistipes sp.]